MDQFWMIAIIIVIGFLAIGLVLWLIYRRQQPKAKKRQSAGSIANAIGATQRFARSNSFKFISPAIVSTNGRTANLDALVVGYFGVLGVKEFGYNGEIYGSATEEEWLQKNGEDERTYFPNPIRQAALDVRVLRDVLFESKLKNVPVEVVAVFCNKKAQLALPRQTGHYTYKDFKTLLSKEKYMGDTGLDLEKVEAAFRKAAQQ